MKFQGYGKFAESVERYTNTRFLSDEQLRRQSKTPNLLDSTLLVDENGDHEFRKIENNFFQSFLIFN